ncbi:TIGR01777 family oxidoreductase [Arthrobacter sp. M4]|uniref:TIGR01777 family oxidoreductase n=1 Tax=Arthrobacter sp. M4 TaxID=218160 RepID=UPI001CDBC98F|nr:TIGR01777 family oxidoreductase [Arthrobacter sp. M4]MCA4132745.1 TIGR01777 family oxidoreductase [Arthrobacter sp. M4]
MRIVVAGASGLIGSALASRLAANGHDVVRLVRRPPTSAGESFWNPDTQVLDPAILDGADAVVNLCGAGIGDRPWTRGRLRTLVDSRLHPTRTLTSAMRKLANPPAVFLSQSASGYYGTGHGKQTPGRAGHASSVLPQLRENAPAGEGVLARLCVDWEKAARTAPLGVRVITPRTGVVLSRSGGALGRLMPLLRAGLGGPLGNGLQHWPWITLDDETAALEFLLTADLEGPVNVCAPELADVNAIIFAIASALRRPALFRMPAPLLKLAMGHLADELILADQPLDSALLASAGFAWTHPTLQDAARWLAG